MKKVKYLVLAILLSVFAVSCGAQAPGGDYNEGGTVNNGGALGNNNIVIPEGHKIIYDIQYELKIEESIAPTIRTINQEVYTLNGYVSNSSESLTYATYVYKVPTEKLNQFLDKVDAQEGVSNKKIESMDVTSAYNELAAEIEVLEASRLAYVKMLEEDNLSLSEVMQLNDKITSIDTKLKQLYKNLDSYNARIDYATITIKYHLVTKVHQPVFLEGYGEYWVNIGKAIVEFLAYSAPFIAVAGIGIITVIIIKKKKHNK